MIPGVWRGFTRYVDCVACGSGISDKLLKQGGKHALLALPAPYNLEGPVEQSAYAQ